MRFSSTLILGIFAAAALAAPVSLETRHHTEAQIAAKNAASGSSSSGCQNQKRNPHHTEAQIAAKNAASGSDCDQNNKARAATTPPADEFGPWDSTEDAFGSWLDKREPHHTEAQIAAKNAASGSSSGCQNQKREPHHTEAQIAAKNAASGSSSDCDQNNKARAATTPPADEFGPWDSTEDAFGSWLDKREPHHTEAQIAAKNAASGSSSSGCQNQKREPHHTEAQIAAKNAASGQDC